MCNIHHVVFASVYIRSNLSEICSIVNRSLSLFLINKHVALIGDKSLKRYLDMNLFGVCPTVCPHCNSCYSQFFPKCSEDIDKHSETQNK